MQLPKSIILTLSVLGAAVNAFPHGGADHLNRRAGPAEVVEAMVTGEGLQVPQTRRDSNMRPVRKRDEEEISADLETRGFRDNHKTDEDEGKLEERLFRGNNKRDEDEGGKLEERLFRGNNKRDEDEGGKLEERLFRGNNKRMTTRPSRVHPWTTRS
ncbi:hypothetical protein B0H66DRAFT_533327 [Apodospora peruviana]|uniref:Uncharacterized protein n=1 Tax=Apodospora peruviana TaxID=516989 RepID=A0AAE0I716_9PEZI|nr:hypothetical protein B0H66DRAFT_533327 [Apodospora peruviana]